MKQLFTLLILLVAVSLAGMAQTTGFFRNTSWESLQFDRRFLLTNQIKAVHVTSLQFHGKELPKSEALLQFDASGNLKHHIELVQNDTSKVQDFFYTSKGTLGWTHTRDKVWNKKYKSGYRFNRNQSIFQVKSYEMLRNDEVMLLDTRQYVYNTDSLLTDIRFLESGKVVKTQKYDYDKVGRVTAERFLNREKEEYKSIEYVYNESGQLEKITTREGNQRAHVYEYNQSGNPVKVEWLEGQKDAEDEKLELIATVSYEYDTKGRLVEMARIDKPMTKAARVSRKQFQYESFPQAQKTKN
ncbi:MAG: hypothetical protein AAF206_22230 [Bacteroidota bacterium]